MRSGVILGCLLVVACSTQDSRMIRLEERFSAVEKQLAGLDKQLASQNERFAATDKRLDRYDERFLVGEKQLAAYKERSVAGEKKPLGDNKPRPAGKNRRTPSNNPPVVATTRPEPLPEQKEPSPPTEEAAKPLPPLDPETALQLLKKQPSLTTAICKWKKSITRLDATTISISLSKAAMKCVGALEKVGLLKAGKCIEWNYDKSCQTLSITPLQGMRISDEYPGGVYFDCGTSNIDSIVSLDQVGLDTYVKYERTDVINTALTSKLTACPLEIPKQNKDVNKCSMHRSLEGNWIYEP